MPRHLSFTQSRSLNPKSFFPPRRWLARQLSRGHWEKMGPTGCLGIWVYLDNAHSHPWSETMIFSPTTSHSWKILLLGQKAETLVLDDLGWNSGLCLWQDYTLSNFLISGLRFFISKMDVMTRLTSPVFKGWRELNPKRQHVARYMDYAPEVGPASFSLAFPLFTRWSVLHLRNNTLGPKYQEMGTVCFFFSSII